MLAQKNRLVITSKGFRWWPDKKEIFTPLFKLTYRITDKNDLPKFAFVVSGKAGKATERNKIRRKLVESLRKRLGGLPTGLEAVVSVHKPFNKENYALIDQVFDKSLPKLTGPSA